MPEMTIDGKAVAGEGTFDVVGSGPRHGHRPGPAVRARPTRRGRAGRGAGSAGLAYRRGRAAQSHARLRRRDRGRGRSADHHAEPGDRQAAPGSGRRAGDLRHLAAVLRGPADPQGSAAGRRERADRARLAAARGRGRDHPVELPARPGHVEDRPGAARGQHRGAQAVPVHPAGYAAARRDRPVGAAARCTQRGHRRRPARRGLGGAPGAAEGELHRFSCPAASTSPSRPRPTSSVSPWSSAATTPRSCCPTPTWPAPCRCCWGRPSSTPARPARCPSASSPRATGTRRWCRRLRTRPQRSRSGRRRIRARSSARCPPGRSSSG